MSKKIAELWLEGFVKAGMDMGLEPDEISQLLRHARYKQAAEQFPNEFKKEYEKNIEKKAIIGAPIRRIAHQVPYWFRGRTATREAREKYRQKQMRQAKLWPERSSVGKAWRYAWDPWETKRISNLSKQLDQPGKMPSGSELRAKRRAKPALKGTDYYLSLSGPKQTAYRDALRLRPGATPEERKQYVGATPENQKALRQLYAVQSNDRGGYQGYMPGRGDWRNSEYRRKNVEKNLNL